MRVVFLGTPEFALPSLKMIAEQGCDICGVFTQPDRPRGRGMKESVSPVKAYALQTGLPLFQYRRMRDAEAQQALAGCKPDVMVTAAFGQILSKENLETAPLGCINVHASLLPGYRGPAPVQWAIINGEKKTGVTTMLTDVGVDTGDILLQRETMIGTEETGGELMARLAGIGAEVLRDTLELLEKGSLKRIKQDESKATHYPMLDKKTGEIDWNEGCEHIRNLARACDPWPGAHALICGRMLKIWKAAPSGTGPSTLKPGDIVSASPTHGFSIMACDGVLELLEIQAAGGKRMSARDYLRGNPMTFDRSTE
jgi:methionyl-tRNA formyltransferase